MKSFSRVIRCGVAASILGLASGAALAALAPMDKLSSSAKVSTAGLDLNQTQDVVTLYGRIQQAARQVCGPTAVNGADYASQAYAHCYSATVAQTVSQLNSAQLSAYYRTQSGSDSRNIAVASQ